GLEIHSIVVKRSGYVSAAVNGSDAKSLSAHAWSSCSAPRVRGRSLVRADRCCSTTVPMLMLAMRRLCSQTATNDLLPVRTLRTGLPLSQTGPFHLSRCHPLCRRRFRPEALAVSWLPAPSAELAVGIQPTDAPAASFRSLASGYGLL